MVRPLVITADMRSLGGIIVCVASHCRHLNMLCLHLVHGCSWTQPCRVAQSFAAGELSPKHSSPVMVTVVLLSC